MPEIKTRFAIEPLRSVAIAAAYVNLGTPLAHTARMFKIVNTSTGDATVSYDGGTTDHDIVPAGSFVLLDLTSNTTYDAELVMAKGTQVAVKGGGAGTVFLSIYFAE